MGLRVDVVRYFAILMATLSAPETKGISMRISSVSKLASLLIVAALYGCDSPETSEPPAAVEAEPVADAVYSNGKIITVNDANPKATAVAIKNGKIIYVGYLRGTKPLTAPSTQQIDLQGNTMVPGFVDAHG